MIVDTLKEEHSLMQRAVAQSRRSFSPELTHFARTMMQAMDDYHTALDVGVARHDAAAGIESVLRSVWPFKPTKFGPACQACDDTGWVEYTCGQVQLCGRQQCATGHPASEHFYVTACECPKGDNRAGRNRQSQLDDISEAMKIRKPRKPGFTRI